MARLGSDITFTVKVEWKSGLTMGRRRMLRLTARHEIDWGLGGDSPATSTIHPEATMIETNKVSVPSHARVLASQKPLVRRDVSASWLLRQVGAEMKPGHGQVKVGDLNAVVYASEDGEDGYSQGKLLRRDMIVGRRDCSVQLRLAMVYSQCDDCCRASSRVPEM